MKNSVINVYNLLGDKYFVNEQQGDILFNKMNLLFNDLYQDGKFDENNNKKIIIDFENIESMTTAGINNSISRYVEMYGIDDVIKFIAVRNIENDSVKSIINLSLTIAQKKYEGKNTKVLTKSI
jgi:hypothetical protein